MLHDCGIKRIYIPYVSKACLETTITVELVYEYIVESLSTLKSARFNVRAIISDNHSTNVSGYSKLVSIFETITSDHFIMYKGEKIYVMYDSVSKCVRRPTAVSAEKHSK